MDSNKETERSEVLLPAKLDDDVLRYVMECAHLNNPDGARLVRSIHHFMHEALRTKPSEVEWMSIRAMADCMDMVRQELVEAGVIDERVPPMFVSEALLTKLRQLRAAFHVNMVRAYPERTHADITAEIDRTCWGTAITADDEILALHRRLAAETLRADLAEARAASKSQECIELRERMAARPAIPRTPEQAIAFIGNQFENMEEAEHLDNVRFQLTVHDLLSAFNWWAYDEIEPSDGAIYEAVSRRADPAAHDAAVEESLAVLDKAVTVTEKGPWQVSDWGQGRIVIQSNDFTHDVSLEISGDFGSVELERAHAEEIACRLNAWPVRQYNSAIGAAGERYHAQFESAQPLPALWRWSDLWNAMDFAAIAGREVYTCIGKGGTYERLGPIMGAGTKRGTILIAYRDIETGLMFCRDPVDFGERMQRIEGQP